MHSPVCLCIWNPWSQEGQSRWEAREKVGLCRYRSQCSHVNHKPYQLTNNNTGTQSNIDFMRQKIIQKNKQSNDLKHDFGTDTNADSSSSTCFSDSNYPVQPLCALPELQYLLLYSMQWHVAFTEKHASLSH